MHKSFGRCSVMELFTDDAELSQAFEDIMMVDIQLKVREWTLSF